ncbi:AAA family ATPase [Aquimarina hainanensis]|uniref:AAA family ATPase n=1 Tax=Aquimarina hainanensis TaxID=1578017 RepID=A0ABW5N638_9FLAO
MKIQKIHIKNFRSIKDESFDLSNDINVLVGVNGAGKSTVLDALATSLSWLVNRIQRVNASGQRISDSDIRIGTKYSSIQILVEEKEMNFDWTLVKSALGTTSNEKSDLVGATDLAHYFQDKLSSESTLPVVVYYPVDRIVNNIAPEISGKEGMYILDVYENSLGGKTNYQSFFEWFRLQDDILNERVGSRQKWIIRNKTWVKRKTRRLLRDIENLSVDDEMDKSEFKYFLNRFQKDDSIYEEPRYLFRELGELLHLSGRRIKGRHPIDRILHDIEYLLHKMGALTESRKDDLIDPRAFPTSAIEKIFHQLEEFFYEEESRDIQKQVVRFVWDALSFAILLSLWWMSNKGKEEIERVFREFNPIRIKDKEKLHKVAFDLIESINNIVSNDAERQDRATRSEGRELKYVTHAIEEFVPNYSNIRVKRLPRPHMLVDKEGVTINLDQLSDGEKNLIALVGDIARRLAIANPGNVNPLEGDGIILIDEIDLHLHPSWQRIMIPKLTKLFPNCQFVFSTHSPQVLSHVQPEKIFLLENIKNELSYSKAMDSYGKNTDRILEDLLNVDARPKKIKNEIHQLFKLIQEGQLKEAKTKLNKLTNQIGVDSELTKAEVLIKRREIIGK